MTTIVRDARRRFGGITVAVLAATACSGEADRTRRAPDPVSVSTVAAAPREVTASALDRPDDPSFPEPLVDLDEIISGGPPPDGIPPIDKPVFTRASSADFLNDKEPVLALTIGGKTRAYPVQIMIWHEIVNDVVGGVPVAVTYCPLCNSALAFDQRAAERVLDFGTSGRLYRSALVMYDRQTESLWTHFTGQAVAGTLTGTLLAAHPVSTVSWAQFKRAHPDGLVLTRETGFSRSYGRNPYPGYDDVNSNPFLFRGESDRRLPAKTRVVAIEHGGEAVAITRDALTKRGVIELTVGGRRIVAFHQPGTASALDKARVDEGSDVGSTNVFVATVGGNATSFAVVDGALVDAATSTRWDVLGRPIDAARAGAASLESVVHLDTFWFAWAAYRPTTRIVNS